MKTVLLFLLCFGLSLRAQEGLHISGRGSKALIPFKLISNLIFIPVTVNGVELTFLLDTGVRETLLFSLADKEVNFKNVEKMKFSGLGDNLSIEGLKSINNSIKIGKDFIDEKHTVYIILNEEFNFSSHVGIPVNGIIGHSFFKDQPVLIDYNAKKITVFNNGKIPNLKLKQFREFPITIENGRPFMHADVAVTEDAMPSKMLLDLGNSDAVWLFPSVIPGFSYNRPNIDDYLGRGFNGDIYGKRSRIYGVSVGEFSFQKVLAAMPDEFSIQHLQMVKDRKGSLGAEFLRRFNIIFDYTGERILLKRSKFYNDPFRFNMSGLDFKHDGVEWAQEWVKVENQKKSVANEPITVGNNFQYKFMLRPVYSVAGIRKNSPGEQSGVRKGDILRTVNGKSASLYTLEELNKIMSEHEGHEVNLTVERGGKPMNFTFTLEDPIPYQPKTQP